MVFGFDVDMLKYGGHCVNLNCNLLPFGVQDNSKKKKDSNRFRHSVALRGH